MNDNQPSVNTFGGLLETTPSADEKLSVFYDLHMACGINLTAIKDKEEFYLKHYADSVYYFQKYYRPQGELADIGSGGGFPGMVLAIFYNDLSVTLIESISKKCIFLDKAVKTLKLSNVSIVNDRAENIKNCKFDTITARGVSKVKDMLRYTAGMRKHGTKLVLYKGEKLDSELAEAKAFIEKEELKVETLRLEEPFTRTYCIISC